MVVGVRTMGRFVAACAPTSTLHEPGGMILGRVPDGVGIDLARGARSLQVASQTEVGIAGDQHFLVHRAMRAVAGNTAFLHRPVLKDKRPFLCGVAFRAGFVLTFHRRA